MAPRNCIREPGVRHSCVVGQHSSLAHLTDEDRREVNAFSRFLEHVQGQPTPGGGHMIVVDHWWRTYALGGPAPPKLWEGDYA